MTDPTEDIADAIVIYINHPDRQAAFSFRFVASNPPEPSREMETELEGLRVLAFPYGDEAERIGRGGQAAENYLVTVMVMRKITDTITRARLLGLVREIRLAIRHAQMAGYSWTADETITKYDPEQLRSSGTFTSVFRTTFAGTVT